VKSNQSVDNNFEVTTTKIIMVMMTGPISPLDLISIPFFRRRPQLVLARVYAFTGKKQLQSQTTKS
jgi:hypothetical protein